jgi:hypothetical protein
LAVAGPAPTTLADTGYGAGADLQAAQEKQLPVRMPPAEGKPARDNPYASQHFAHDPQAGTVTRPQKRLLDHEGHTTKAGQRVERYRCHHHDCPVRALCTRDPKGRQIEVWPHTALVQAMRATLQTPLGQAQYQQRSQLIERRFGPIKQHDGFRRWTVWGLETVRTQWSLLCTTLNLRVLYNRWRPNLPESWKTAAAMTGRTAKDGIWLAALLNRASQTQDAVGRAIKRHGRRLPKWAT